LLTKRLKKLSVKSNNRSALYYFNGRIRFIICENKLKAIKRVSGE